MPKKYKKKQAKNVDDEISNLMKKSDEIALKKEIKDLSKQDDKKDRAFIRARVVKNTGITISQTNPKKPKTNAYKRYQKYKSAKSTIQFFNKGGTQADLMFDYQHGFVKFLS